jgi:hypothetical protein
MCETIEKTAISVYFLASYESKEYFKGTLFSLKMQYLNKQGQQASSKILKHPDEVTRLDGTLIDIEHITPLRKPLLTRAMDSFENFYTYVCVLKHVFWLCTVLWSDTVAYGGNVD